VTYNVKTLYYLYYIIMQSEAIKTRQFVRKSSDCQSLRPGANSRRTQR